jgi:inner membrane protein
MDNLTHSLVGALIGQAGLKRKSGLAMPALIVGANLPDVDAACFLWLDGVQHLGFRRGITHGPIAWVLLPLILAGLLWGWDRWQAKRGKRPEGRLPVHFGWLYALAFIACLTHPAFDWLNVYGIRLLEPFSSRWFYGDTLFIIDVWLWLGLGFAAWLSLRREKRGGHWRRPAQVTLAGALAYIGLNSGITWFTEASAKLSEPYLPDQIVIASPPPIWSLDRDTLVGLPNDWWVRDPETRFIRPITEQRCAWPAVDALRRTNPDLDAFLFWSRAPFAERAEDGSVLIRDARFYDPRAADRFTVALPEVKCESLPPPS